MRRYLPGKAVLNAADLANFATPSPATVTYTGPSRVDMPVIPVQIFGLFYGLDVVLVSKHDDWDMHEYARVDLPSGPLWLAKDARPTGVQTIIADVDDIESWVPEAAVPRRRGAVRVDDQSSGRDVDLSVAYTNWDGQPVDVRVTGRVHRKPPHKRNGSTMGHSRQSTAVALDLQRFGPARQATVNIGGVDVGIKRLLGIYPMKFLLEQAQGGVMVASQRQLARDGGFTLTRPGANPIDPATGEPGWPTHGTEGWTVQAGTEDDGTACLIALRDGPVITLRYVFVDGGLRRAEAWQVDHAQPVTVMRFAPALPDLSRPFAGTATSRFTLDINGQQGQGTGTVSAAWADPDHVDIRLRPEKPWWLADRPMDGRLSYDADGVELDMHRVPVSVDPE
ncbi:MAG: hypothetical protein GXP62_15745 [Oligoflexia bacterium]|nr:hypothetical protein [Oligoflexia bacterium]